MKFYIGDLPVMSVPLLSPELERSLNGGDLIRSWCSFPYDLLYPEQYS